MPSEQPQEEAPTSAPGVVLIHDLAGLNPFAEDSAARFAAMGCFTVAPDFAAASLPDGSSDTGQQLLSLNDSAVVKGVSGAIDWLCNQPSVDAARIAVAGFGWGGAYALMAAAHDRRVVVAIDVGGTITHPVSTPQSPGSPLNFVGDIEGAIFAAYPEHDPLLPHNQVERLERQLKDHDRSGEVKTYSGTGPRFWEDDALPATQRMWERLKNFLSDNLFTGEIEANSMGGYPNEASRLHA